MQIGEEVEEEFTNPRIIPIEIPKPAKEEPIQAPNWPVKEPATVPALPRKE